MRRGQTTDDTSRSWLDRVRGGEEDQTTDESRNWFDRMRAEYGLSSLLLVVGIILFLIPEPATSTAGLLLIGAGAFLWIAGWLRERRPSTA